MLRSLTDKQGNLLKKLLDVKWLLNDLWHLPLNRVVCVLGARCQSQQPNLG